MKMALSSAAGPAGGWSRPFFMMVRLAAVRAAWEIIRKIFLPILDIFMPGAV